MTQGSRGCRGVPVDPFLRLTSITCPTLVDTPDHPLPSPRPACLVPPSLVPPSLVPPCLVVVDHSSPPVPISTRQRSPNGVIPISTNRDSKKGGVGMRDAALFVPGDGADPLPAGSREALVIPDRASRGLLSHRVALLPSAPAHIIRVPPHRTIACHSLVGPVADVPPHFCPLRILAPDPPGPSPSTRRPFLPSTLSLPFSPSCSVRLSTASRLLHSTRSTTPSRSPASTTALSADPARSANVRRAWTGPRRDPARVATRSKAPPLVPPCPASEPPCRSSSRRPAVRACQACRPQAPPTPTVNHPRPTRTSMRRRACRRLRTPLRRRAGCRSPVKPRRPPRRRDRTGWRNRRPCVPSVRREPPFRCARRRRLTRPVFDEAWPSHAPTAGT